MRTPDSIAALTAAVLIAAASWAVAADPAKPDAGKSPPPAVQPETAPHDKADAADKADKPDAKAPVKADTAKVPFASPMLTIKLAFMGDARLFPYDINVDMKGETVELSGKVASEDEKRAAAEIAQKIEGVKAVKNELDISKDIAKSLARRKDEAITQYVKERFAKSKTLEKANFDVKTEDGVVTLSGKTRFQVIALEAAETARQVPGVRAVHTVGIQTEASE
jgi:hyperosmotically inducible protein